MKQTLQCAAVILLAFAGDLSAQHPRQSVLIDHTPGSDSGTPAIVSRGEESAVAFIDGANLGGPYVFVSTSDGRGLSWSSPVRVDSDATLSAKNLQDSSIDLFEDRIYVCWQDMRHGSAEVYFNFSTDGGVTWAGEQLIDKGYGVGSGGISRYDMAVSPDTMGGADHVYFLCATFIPGTLNANLYFTASHDGGGTFSPAVHLPAGYGAGSNRVDDIDIEARGGTNVFAIWQDNRAGAGATQYDLFFQYSSTGGGTWLPSDRVLNSVVGEANGSIALAVEGGGHLMAVWNDERISGSALLDEVRCNYSLSGPYGWLGTDILIGNYTPGLVNTGSLDAVVNNGLMAVAWTDNRTGALESYVSVSSTGGATWFEHPLSLGGASTVKIKGHDDYLGVFWDEPLAMTVILGSFSRDGGNTWDAPLPVSLASGDCEWMQVNYNNSYGNFLLAWHSDDLGTTSNVYVGGVRPATLEPVGTFKVGDAVHFEVDHFPAAEAGWSFGVLVSGGAGSWTLPFGDGRETGLLNDTYLVFSRANIPGSLSGTVDAAGHGFTPDLVIPSLGTLPTFHCVGVSFDTSSGITLGALTDIETRTVLP